MKNKKTLALFVALTLALCSSAFASGKFGIGVQGGYVASANGHGNASLTFKIPNVPPVFAVNVGIWDGGLHRIGATADWWISNPNIVGPLNWFYGPGLAAGASIDVGGKSGVYVGGRFVIGLNVFVIDPLEIYLQAAAQIGIDTTNEQLFDWGVPLNLGIRFWF